MAQRAEPSPPALDHKLELLLRQTPLATIEWDRQSRVAEWNPAAEAIFGYSRAEIVGRQNVIELIFAEPHRKQVEEQWRGQTAKREGFLIVTENIAREGRDLVCSWAVAPLLDADGRWIGAIAQAQDITARDAAFKTLEENRGQLENAQQQLHSLAFFDPLTELPNRALFSDRLRQSITDAAWHRDLLGLMLLDLDRFKGINDTLGHGTGDQLLREAASRLGACVRAYDTVARLGGDEFAILLPEVRDGADLGGIARKIIAAFAEPFRLEDKELFVTCSIGIVLYPSDGKDATELLRYADAAMYDAKSKGRNNFQFYSSELTVRSSERLVLDAELRQAERNGELELYYQPQIDLPSGTLIGAEALLRWNHPTRGLVMPDKFIGIAEDTGLIVGIGEWVLRTACRTARCWNEARTGGIVRVAVNLSPRQFRMNDLVGTIRSVLEETGCRPEWLECEITESLLLDDSEGIRAMLFEINTLGIALAIDDFGTGYSSLGYLNRYPVGTLKIDRSFVRDLMTDLDSAELVKAIISMARTLHLLLVAEGVEIPGQADFLRSHGCHTGQGWLYGKAMPQAQFETLLKTTVPTQSEPLPAALTVGKMYFDGLSV
ncbi:MAG: EAL domain-containing protein [Sterolibacterium sp.]